MQLQFQKINALSQLYNFEFQSFILNLKYFTNQLKNISNSLKSKIQYQIPYNCIMMPSQKTQAKFEMIQNYRQKLKLLQLNLTQSEKLNQTLQQDLLKIGQQSNTLLISISVKTTRVTELKSINPQRQKQLNYAREQLKRIQYKTQKHEIKLKEYEDRLKRFQDMYLAKKDKNQALSEKIHKLQLKLKEQKEKQTQLNNELNLIQPKKDLNQMSYLKVQSQYLKSLSKKSNPIDDMQIQILNLSMKMKKLTQQQQELKRKNNQLKPNINKIQQQIQQIQEFMNNNSCIPEFIQANSKADRQRQQGPYQTSRTYNFKDEQQERILKYSSAKYNLANQSQSYSSVTTKTQQHDHSIKHNIQYSREHKLQDRIRKPPNQLPCQIMSSLPTFQNLKSRSILDSLLTKHTEMTEKEHFMMDRLKQNSLLMNQFRKINLVLESQIAQENSKLSAFNIRNKKYTQMHQKGLQ